MSKFFGISYSGISSYLNCPRQFEAKYITKEVIFQPNIHTIKGNELHTAMELRIRDKIPLPENWNFLEDFSKSVDNLQRNSKIFTERKLSVDRNGNRVDYNDYSNRYIFGKDDLSIIQNERARVIDYKTGKIRDNDYQLRLQAQMIFGEHENLENISLSFFFVEHNHFSRPLRLKRNEALTDEILRDFDNFERDVNNDNFPLKKNGLCKNYCDVLSCKHNGRKI